VNHDAQNDIQKNNSSKKPKDDFSAENWNGAYYHFPLCEEGTFQNKIAAM
jgi:hypothetical protein